MTEGRGATRVMNNVLAYRLWQSPFAERKLAPVLRHNDLAAVRRVLDVGCGPGTNARHFLGTDYLGIDRNPGYVADARRRFGDRFRVADVREDFDAGGGGFDFILVNSLLHHVATPDVRTLLARLAGLLTADGRVHILDLVMPERPGLARLLARWDRGEHARPLGEWRALFSEAFAPVFFEPYPLGAFGVTLWNMVYFQGRRR
ncbi:MAG TPA: class I SAM-dependent methyltransferase [Thermoanaerobaculia bacterium]|nr:class I SAM-dependent methyltransferase [Thermoanaerobaculia bacterium]